MEAMEPMAETAALVATASVARLTARWAKETVAGPVREGRGGQGGSGGPEEKGVNVTFVGRSQA